jgi:hypothetical protein
VASRAAFAGRGALPGGAQAGRCAGRPTARPRGRRGLRQLLTRVLMCGRGRLRVAPQEGRAPPRPQVPAPGRAVLRVAPETASSTGAGSVERKSASPKMHPLPMPPQRETGFPRLGALVEKPFIRLDPLGTGAGKLAGGLRDGQRESVWSVGEDGSRVPKTKTRRPEGAWPWLVRVWPSTSLASLGPVSVLSTLLVRGPSAHQLGSFVPDAGRVPRQGSRPPREAANGGTFATGGGSGPNKASPRQGSMHVAGGCRVSCPAAQPFGVHR